MRICILVLGSYQLQGTKQYYKYLILHHEELPERQARLAIGGDRPDDGMVPQAIMDITKPPKRRRRRETAKSPVKRLRTTAKMPALQDPYHTDESDESEVGSRAGSHAPSSESGSETEKPPVPGTPGDPVPGTPVFYSPVSPARDSPVPGTPGDPDPDDEYIGGVATPVCVAPVTPSPHSPHSLSPGAPDASDGGSGSGADAPTPAEEKVPEFFIWYGCRFTKVKTKRAWTGWQVAKSES